jgi:hypothetical protein
MHFGGTTNEHHPHEGSRASALENSRKECSRPLQSHSPSGPENHGPSRSKPLMVRACRTGTPNDCLLNAQIARIAAFIRSNISPYGTPPGSDDAPSRSP